MTGGILQNVLIVVHHLGVVREEKVHFDSCYTQSFEPRQFLLTPVRIKETVLRLGSAFPYPGSTGVVPQVDLHALLLCIVYKFLYVTVFHLRPLPVYQTVRPSHVGGKVDVLHVEVELFGSMIVCPIHPGRHSGFDPVRLELRRGRQIRDKG